MPNRLSSPLKNVLLKLKPAYQLYENSNIFSNYAIIHRNDWALVAFYWKEPHIDVFSGNDMLCAIHMGLSDYVRRNYHIRHVLNGLRTINFHFHSVKGILFHLTSSFFCSGSELIGGWHEQSMNIRKRGEAPGKPAQDAEHPDYISLYSTLQHSRIASHRINLPHRNF